ncbi:Gfo/Idh/MocA family oxidoreductase [Rhodococcus qingshengii]|uniref:Gfo/Idh/MocA family protein n=1 Tax=Rhodococcus qingshengii TaxID=334542 RepID=UPI001AE2B9E1|nr:Gfo/Idh/MocA family oxidoreductase [Rhodococcus qingshengii]MBP1049517.1 Gfo/Idh/MocA family oxidoreductase [Rhodococcus qingshengii]WCT04636.1 Gfo/Idh/MocA family oxidoreductase [Rhodococcus qingshengii]
MGARIGVVGLGRIGSYHARNLLTLNGVDALVVTDVDARRTSDVASELDVESAADPDALLASGIDGVLIAASSSSHADLIEAAVRRDIPTFCEKPVADSIESSVRVLATAEQTSVPVQIGFQRRFDPSFVAAYDAVRSGELGWIHTLRSTTLDPAPPPISYIEHSGGIFRDCSIHDFDIVRWVSGREVTTVFATGSNQGDRGIADAGDVDTAATVLTFEGGTIAVVSNTRYNGRGYDCRLEVLGSADSVVAGLDDRLPLRSLDPETSFPSKEPYTFFMDRFTSAYRAELEAFLGVVAGRRESPCTPADAVESAWISEAATHSLREGRPVTITEVKDLFLHDKNEAHT